MTKNFYFLKSYMQTCFFTRVFENQHVCIYMDWTLMICTSTIHFILKYICIYLSTLFLYLCQLPLHEVLDHSTKMRSATPQTLDLTFIYRCNCSTVPIKCRRRKHSRPLVVYNGKSATIASTP